MFDVIKKVAFTGMGVAALTKEKAEELAKELVEKGKLSEQEGQKFVAELLVRKEESKEAMRKQTEKIVDTALSRVPLAKASDLEELSKEITRLRGEIEILKEQLVSSQK